MESMFLNPSRVKGVNRSRPKASKAKARVKPNSPSNQELIGATTAKSLLIQQTIAAIHLRTTLSLQKGERASLLLRKESLTAEAKDGPMATFLVIILAPTPMLLPILVPKHLHPTLRGIHMPHGLKTKEISDSCSNTIKTIIATFLRFQRSTNLFLDMNMRMFLIPW
jgi:hypothetical protein